LSPFNFLACPGGSFSFVTMSSSVCSPINTTVR
jgi:hypothetical protein